MKKLITLAAAVVSAITTSFAATITVKNFDEDLATVYVDDVAVAHGETVEVGATAKIELKDFRNDYYFRFAPATQTDRQLGFDCWEGVPEGYASQNPATIPVDANLTITANVDVKGYCWELDENNVFTNSVHRWNWAVENAANRRMKFSSCANAATKIENNLVADFVQRVKYQGKNYTMTAFGTRNMFANSHIGTISFSPRWTSVAWLSFDGRSETVKTYWVTNLVGAADIRTCDLNSEYAFSMSVSLVGPAIEQVPQNATKLGTYCFSGSSQLTGMLKFNQVTSIAGTAFSGCTRLTGVEFGPNCPLTSVGTSAFPANVTNIIVRRSAPAAVVVDGLVGQQTAADGAHKAIIRVDGGDASWWNLVTAPTDNEIAAGMPEDCMGVYVSTLGKRLAWIVSTTPLSGTLLVGDMLMTGYAGFTPTTGLEVGDTVTLTAPDGYDRCQLQHLVNGVWTTYTTVEGSSFTYTHGTELTRAVWSVDGYRLTTSVNAYNGSITATLVSGREVATGIYSKDSVVRLTATGSTEHPTSHFNGWSGDASGDEAAVEVTIDTDKEVTADFYPDEWIYTSKSNISDGEWTITSSTLTDNRNIKVSGTSGGHGGLLCLDLSLPVHPANDLTTTYYFTDLATSPANLRQLKVGPELTTISAAPFYQYNGQDLERIDGLGATKLTSFGYAFLYDCGSSPLRSAVYEANDFIPPGLLYVDWAASMAGCPYLTGTCEFNAAKNFYTYAQMNFGIITGRMYKETLSDGTVVGVTNLLLTAEGMETVGSTVFNGLRLSSLTFGSTNLQSIVGGAFVNYNGRFRSLTFLAHAPTVAALDNLVKVAATTNMTIYCSKYAPGWKDLRMNGYSLAEEWAGRPAGCWGIYQTATGNKRYYLVQKDSKYDDRSGLMLLVK